MEAKNINDSCIFDLQWPGMLLQSAAVVAKKLLWVEDKITALSKKCLLGVVCKVLNRKILSGETFCYQN